MAKPRRPRSHGRLRPTSDKVVVLHDTAFGLTSIYDDVFLCFQSVYNLQCNRASGSTTVIFFRAVQGIPLCSNNTSQTRPLPHFLASVYNSQKYPNSFISLSSTPDKALDYLNMAPSPTPAGRKHPFERVNLLVFVIGCLFSLALWNGFARAQDPGSDNQTIKVYHVSRSPLCAYAVETKL